MVIFRRLRTKWQALWLQNLRSSSNVGVHSGLLAEAKGSFCLHIYCSCAVTQVFNLCIYLFLRPNFCAFMHPLCWNTVWLVLELVVSLYNIWMFSRITIIRQYFFDPCPLASLSGSFLILHAPLWKTLNKYRKRHVGSKLNNQHVHQCYNVIISNM